MSKLFIFLFFIVVTSSAFVVGGLAGILVDTKWMRIALPQYNYALWKEIEENDHEYIDFQAFGNDKWQRVCFLGPYNNSSSSVLGFRWNISDFTNALSSDGYNVLIFTTDSTVIDFIVQSRSHGDFGGMSGKCLARDDSMLVQNNNLKSFTHE